MSNRPEAGERSGLVEGENEARQRSAVSNRAVTLGDAVSSIETSNCQIPVGKQDPRESESRPHSIGRITTAFVATALVVMGMLVVTGALLVIAGNPQNMIIGSLSHIPYGTFAAALWPVAGVGLILTALLIAVVYRREFLTREHLPAVATISARHHRPLVIKSVLVAVAMMVLFFAGQPVAKVAIVGGALVLVTRKVKADKVYREIDWTLLLMFVGLFVVVTG